MKKSNQAMNNLLRGKPIVPVPVVPVANANAGAGTGKSLPQKQTMNQLIREKAGRP